MPQEQIYPPIPPAAEAGNDARALTHKQKATEAHFLADNFGIAPIRAAELVVGEGAEADELASQVMLEERERNPLEGVPAPSGDKDPEHIEEGVGDLEKPVVHDESAPS